MDLITSATLGDYTSMPPRTKLITVSDVVEQALIQERKGLHSHEQRESDRYPCSRLIELTPWDLGKNQCMGDAITVASRNLSRTGLGFYHKAPLAARHAIIQLYPGSDQPGLMIKLIWCRFLCPDWYDNGGRFIRIATEAAA